MRKREKHERRTKGCSKKKESRRRQKTELFEEDAARLSESDDDPNDPKSIACLILKLFPTVGIELKQLLQIVDSGQAADISGIPERRLRKHLAHLFILLGLTEIGHKIFILPPTVGSTFNMIGSVILSHIEPAPVLGTSVAPDHAPKRRVLGPELSPAGFSHQTGQENGYGEEDTETFVGPPPPPTLVAEDAFSNEAERFEEVTRIMSADADSPYDILGANHAMPLEKIKKRYWKLSLFVHPDKNSHPDAHKAFVILNMAFKALENPDKRMELDEKIKREQQKVEMEMEIKILREAAEWRRTQGISMEGDDELLAVRPVEISRKRDEWMTTLPPKSTSYMVPRKVAMTTKNGKEDYVSSSHSVEQGAELMEDYNKAKRPKSLVEKHIEELVRKSASKGKAEAWAGSHPWKPWDHEKDLSAGRKSVKFDSENMARGFSNRFSAAASSQGRFL